MTTTVSFGGVTFSTDPTSSYKLAKLDGWYSGAPVRPIVTERPVADGAFNTGTVYRSSRVITLKGWVTANTPPLAISTAWRAFTGIMSDGKAFTLTVADDSETLTATVVLQSAPEVLPIRGTAAEVNLTMIAVDPVKYSTPTTTVVPFPYGQGGLKFNLFTAGGVLDFTSTGTSGKAVFTNTGTAPVYPSFTVVGPATNGFTIQCIETGETVSVAYNLNAGDTVTINQRTGRVVLNGITDITRYLTSAQFFSLSAGEVASIQVNAIGTQSNGTLSVITSNGYW